MKNDIRGLRLENNAWVYSYRIAGRARRMTLAMPRALSRPMPSAPRARLTDSRRHHSSEPTDPGDNFF
jgi:hypothetical protein